jgi:hypothetical protein
MIWSDERFTGNSPVRSIPLTDANIAHALSLVQEPVPQRNPAGRTIREFPLPLAGRPVQMPKPKVPGPTACTKAAEHHWESNGRDHYGRWRVRCRLCRVSKFDTKRTGTELRITQRKLEINGQLYTLPQAAKLIGIAPKTMYTRAHNGATDAEMIQPIQKRGPKAVYDEQ